MKRLTIGIIFISLLLNCVSTKEKTLQTFIDNHTQTIGPILKEANLTYWEAAITGDEVFYKKYAELDLKIREIYSNPDDYKYLKDLQTQNSIQDPLLERQLNCLVLSYLPNQVEPELLKQIVELGAKIEQTFSTYRGSIDRKKVTNNDIETILKNETESKKRKKAWLASKEVGDQVAEDLIQLVKLRNQSAHALGFNNYHTLYLTASEQDVHVITAMFNELETLTREPFQTLKSELDEILTKQYNLKKNKLMPWHYHDPFFQETPLVYDIDLDRYYENKDVKLLAENYFTSLDLPVASILDNSDLYEKEGKNPHAFCTDIDREGDVRILCNVQNNERWMETMLHELGHAVYDKYMDPALPFLLREPAHIFTTEAVAMYFGRKSRDADWMKTMLNLSDEETEEIRTITEKYARLKQLIFARWAMVMFDFEKNLYSNPDQDLNKLWWDTVEKYQMVKRPGNRNMPDWASKIHFTIAPCYYHNYLLGELFASQIHHTLSHNPQDIGIFFKERIFRPGATYSWNTMIGKATGENLNPKYFVDQFIEK